MVRASSVALLGGSILLLLAVGVFRQAPDRTNHGDDILPPAGADVPINESKPERLPRGGSVVNVSNLSGNEAEVSLDVNPTNPDNLVIFGHAPNLQVINSFYTLDGGQNWARVTLGNADDGLSGWLRGDPSVVFDDDGAVYLAYGVRQQSPNRVTVVVAKSIDSGQSYTLFTHVQTNLDIGAYPGNDKWHLATGPDPDEPAQTNVYLAWTQNINEGGLIDQRVVIARSVDGGAAFSTPVIVNDASVDGTSLSNTYVDPAVGPDGEVYVAWYNIINREIWVDYSPDGLLFGDDVLISTSQTGSNSPIPAQPSRGVFAGPVIDTDRSNGTHHGRLYIAYTDTGVSGLPDVNVCVQYSDDHAATWSPRTLVNDDAGSSSQFLPWLDVDQVQGTVGVAFYDARNDPMNRKVEVFVAPSYDGGDTFAANLALSSGPSDQSAGNPAAWFGNYLEFIGLALHDGVASGVWSDNSTDLSDLDFFHGRVTLAPPVSTPDLTDAARDLSWFRAPSPNPFRGRTEFAFGLATPSVVRLAVYDVAGRTVRVLLHEERPAGEQNVSWDGRDTEGQLVPPGAYLSRFEAGGRSMTRKVTVLE